MKKTEKIDIVKITLDKVAKSMNAYNNEHKDYYMTISSTMMAINLTIDILDNIDNNSFENFTNELICLLNDVKYTVKHELDGILDIYEGTEEFNDYLNELKRIEKRYI